MKLFLSVLFLAVANFVTAQDLVRFVVISDTHFGSKVGVGPMGKVPKALKNLLDKKPLSDAVFVVGDITESGKPEQYKQAFEVFSDPDNVPKNLAVYFVGGNNHDNSNDGFKVFPEILKQALNQYVEIKDYPFITISEGGKHNHNPDSIAYNREAKKFLAEKLAYAAEKYPGKPIFVFMHVPPENTCYGSLISEGWGTPYFTPVLNQYPQIVLFSGHSHFPVGDPRSIHQDVFTAINDGSLNYSEVEPGVVTVGIHPQGFENINEGLIVNILENGSLKIERWDTYRNEEILPVWLIEAPHDGSRFAYKNRNGLPAPHFSAKDKPTISLITADSITVTFPQATDNEVVHHYLVDILDGKQLIASYSQFSLFYFNSLTPQSLTVSFSKLPSRKKLQARIIAVDSYNNQSVPIIKSFTLH
jgi:predicted phosphodiesterase